MSMEQDLLTQVHKTLLKTRKTIAVAESCTGGLASSLLTSLSKSSKYFILGTVTYSNRAKTRILGIPTSLINKKGAVSCEVALKMAENIRKIAKTDFGLSITGIAGPTGAKEFATFWPWPTWSSAPITWPARSPCLFATRAST